MDSDTAGEPVRVIVIVTRTGGIAGMKRQWQVDSHGDEASEWITLIEECPWSRSSYETDGADRFIWSIVARLGPERHDAELSDEQVDGPWASLVEAVRTRGEAVPPPRRPADRGRAPAPSPGPTPTPGPEPGEPPAPPAPRAR